MTLDEYLKNFVLRQYINNTLVPSFDRSKHVEALRYVGTYPLRDAVYFITAFTTHLNGEDKWAFDYYMPLFLRNFFGMRFD